MSNSKLKKISSYLFFILLFCLMALVVFSYVKKRKLMSYTTKPQIQNFSTDAVLPDPANSYFGKTSLDLPFTLTSPAEGSMFLHYFLNGTLNKISEKEGNFILSFENPAKNLPEIVITKETRLMKITPPYGQSNSVAILPKDLKKGQKLVVSIEYDLFLKTWIVRDVLLPTDQN